MVAKVDAKPWARETMKGLWASPFFSFTEDGQLDEAGFEHNVEHFISMRIDGIGFGFSEPWYCTLDERLEAMRIIVEKIDGRVPSYLHATDHSIQNTIQLTNQAAAVGADAVMVWTPYEFSKSEQLIWDYFSYLEANTDIAIIVYNTDHSGRLLSPALIEKLSTLEGVCAIKNATFDFGHGAEVHRRVGESIVVSHPHEEQYPGAILYLSQQILLGSTGSFLLQSPHYQPVREYQDVLREGRAGEGMKLFYELQPLRDVREKIYQSLKGAAGGEVLHPIEFIKTWMDLIGMHGGPVRAPMHPVSEEQRDQLRSLIAETDIAKKLWPNGLST